MQTKKCYQATLDDLTEHWKPGLPLAEKRAVLWQYNRSDPYIDTILLVADKLGQG